jgi:hypothetical protein
MSNSFEGVRSIAEVLRLTGSALRSYLVDPNTYFWTGVGLAGFYTARKLVGYASDHLPSTAQTTVVAIGDVYKMQNHLAASAREFYSIIGHVKLRRFANLHSSKIVLIQIVTNPLTSKTCVKSDLIANHGWVTPRGNGTAVTQGLGNDIGRGEKVFSTEETKKAIEKKVSKRILGSNQLILLLTDQGGTSGGAIAAGQIKLLKQYTGARHVYAVVVESQISHGAQPLNVEYLSRHPINFAECDFIMMVQQPQGLENEANTNKSLGPLLAAIAASKTQGQDVNDITEHIVKPQQSKLLAILDVGDLAVTTDSMDRGVLTNLTNWLEQDPENFYKNLYVSKDPKVWRFRRVDELNEARPAALVVLKPPYADIAIVEEIKKELELKLGLDVRAQILHDWRKHVVRPYLILSPISEEEARCFELYSCNHNVFATPEPTAREVLSNEEAERRRAHGKPQATQGGVSSLD